MSLFNMFLTEVLMNTKTETSDLKWTIFSTAKPEVRNPSFHHVICITNGLCGDWGFLASSCSFVTSDIKEFLIWLVTDRIKAGQSECGIQSILEADALIYPINLEVERTGCPPVSNTAARKRHIYNWISWRVVARVFLPAASATETAQLTDVSEGRRLQWRRRGDFWTWAEILNKCVGAFH